MREIKFRAKIIRAGKWSKWIIGSLDFTKYTYHEARIVGYDDPVQYWYKIDKNTIGQYTGLKDKNGVEIYEGDIIKIDDIIGKVMFDEDYLGYFIHVKEEYAINEFESGIQPLYQYQEEIEVIGNIYDNPELLEEE